MSKHYQITSAPETFIGPMIREAITSPPSLDKTLAFLHATPGSPSNRKSGVYRRDVPGSPSTWPLYTFANGGALSTTENGNVIIQRQDGQISMWWSQDEITWESMAFMTLSNPLVPIYWGVAHGSGVSQYTQYLQNLKVFGALGGCSTGFVCNFGTTASQGSCLQDPRNSFVECGVNSWRRILATSRFASANQNLISPTQIRLLQYQQPWYYNGESVENAFVKQVSGSGSITIRVNSILNCNPGPTPDPAYCSVGIILWNPLNSTVNNVNNNQFVFYVRNIGTLGVSYRIGGAINPGFPGYLNTINYNPYPSTANLFIRVIKTGSVIECFYSTTSGATWTPLMVPMNFPGMLGTTFFAGVTQRAAQYFSNPSATVSNVTFTGFTGYCNNRGDCGSDPMTGQLDQCICKPEGGWIGTFCEQLACFGISSASSSVCSGQGSCVAPNTCSCNSKWSGPDCSYPVCFGFGAQNSQVCSGNGGCVGVDSCNCDPGYSLANCNGTTCFGVSNQLPNVCNGRGTCSQTDVCTCRAGWTGPQCLEQTCQGIPQSNNSTCSGRGTCVFADTCSCPIGWSGTNCQFPICFGRLANDTSVCSGRGSCLAPNTCSCITNWVNTTCDEPVCYGIRATNPSVCTNGNGVCASANFCTACKPRWTGTRCQTPNCFGKTGTQACNSRGTCVSIDTCACTAGWGGNECEQRACNGIVASNSTVCNGVGFCNPGNTCSCNSGWSGQFCNITTCFGFLSTSPSVCSSNGNCVSPGKCSCNAGFNGTQCQLPVCNGFDSSTSQGCSFRGTCTAPGVCSCNPGWFGANCSIPSCFGIRADNPIVCSSQGSCINLDTCSCNPNRGGSSCSLSLCNGMLAPIACTGNGDCVAPNTCSCRSGYTGQWCQTTQCTNGCPPQNCTALNICSCVGPCACNSNFTGTNCEIPICSGLAATNPSVCSSRGTCINAGACSCNAGWTGSNCQDAVCAGISASNPLVCSSGGSCTAPNTCSCSSGRFGTNCENFMCNGRLPTDPLGCNNRGTCIGGDLCNCTTPGYAGNLCQSPICYGSSGPSACSGKGTCTSPNQCLCPQHHNGTQCEQHVLFNFVQSVCGTGCTLNLTQWNNCLITQGPSCYCAGGLNGPNISLACDPFNILRSVRIVNSGLKGIWNASPLLPILSLNLTGNQLDMPNLATNIPQTLSSLFLGSNSMSVSSKRFEVFGVPALSNLNVDYNSICGPYPDSWRNRAWILSTVGHAKSFWCTTLNPSVCAPLALPSSITLLPHETSLNLTTPSVHASCVNLLASPELVCQSLGNTASNRFPAYYSTSIVCNRAQMLSDVDQIVNLAWSYPSPAHTEVISTSIQVVNLPLISVTSINRPIFSGSTLVTLSTNANITRYKKQENHNIKCGVFPDGYFVTATINGAQASCLINLVAPSSTPKTIALYEHFNQFAISSPWSFYFVDPVMNMNASIKSQAEIMLPINRGGVSLYGAPSTVYSLVNSALGLRFVCSVGSNVLSGCMRSVSTLPNDMNLITLTLMDETRGYAVANFTQLFYTQFVASSVRSQVALANGVSNTFIVNGTSSFTNHSILGVTYSILGASSLPVTSLSSVSLQFVDSSTSAMTMSYRLTASIPGFGSAVISGPIEVFWVLTNPIAPSSSIFLVDVKTFNFSYGQPLGVSVQPFVECQISGTPFPAKWYSAKEFGCLLSAITGVRSVTFWYRNPITNIAFQLSSNSIALSFLDPSPIAFSAGASEFGYAGMSQSLAIRFTGVIPANMNQYIRCVVGTTEIQTAVVLPNRYNCTYTPTMNHDIVSLKMEMPFDWKVANVDGSFMTRIDINLNPIYGTVQSAPGAYSRFVLDTASIIVKGKMASDCKDLLVAFRGTPIDRIISQCNTAYTMIFFAPQETINLFTTSNDYQILAGNSLYVGSSTFVTKTFYDVKTTYSYFTERGVPVSSNTVAYAAITFSTSTATTDPASVYLVNKVAPFKVVTLLTFPTYNDSMRYDVRVLRPNQAVISNLANYTAIGSRGWIFNYSHPFNETINCTVWATYIPTGEVLMIVPSTQTITFINQVSITTSSQRIYTRSLVTITLTSTVTLTLSRTIPVTTGAMVRAFYMGNLQLQSGSTTITGTQVFGGWRVTGMTQTSDVDVVEFTVMMQAHSDPNYWWELNSARHTIGVYISPLRVDFPLNLSPDYFGQRLNFSFIHPSVGFASNIYYNFYVYSSSVGISSPTRTVTVSNGGKPSFLLPSLAYPRTPVMVYLTVQFYHTQLSGYAVTSSTTIPYIEKTPVTRFWPFIHDLTGSNQTSITLTWTVSKAFQVSPFTFQCNFVDNKGNTTITPATTLTGSWTLICPITFRNVSEAFNSTIQLAQVYNDRFMTIPYTFEWVTLKFNPQFTSSISNETIQIIRNDSTGYNVPSQWRSFSYRIVSNGDNETFEFPIVIGSAGEFFWNKTAFSLTQTYDITNLFFKIQAFVGGAWTDLTSITTPLIYYQVGSITSVNPIACIVVTNKDVVLTFDRSIFTSGLQDQISYYCQGETAVYPAIVQSSNQLNCKMTWALYPGTPTLPMSAFFMMPSLSTSTRVYFPINTTNPEFYYLTRGDMSFQQPSSRLFYPTPTTSNMWTSIAMVIPNRVRPFVKLRFTYPITNLGHFSATTTWTSQSGGSNFFSSTTSLSGVGYREVRTQLYDPTQTVFSNLSNDFEPIVIIPNGGVQAIYPQALTVGYTDQIRFTTNVDTTVDYKNTTFACRYGSISLNPTVTSPAIIDPVFKRAFLCNMTWNTANVAIYVSIWANYLNSTLRICSQVSLPVFTTNFFQPSYGLLSGGQTVTMERYLLGIPQNVLIAGVPGGSSYPFVCTVVDTKLICTTPSIPPGHPSLRPFHFYTLQYELTGQIFDARWIIYERRTIVQYSPRVIPISTTSVSMSTSLNLPVQLVSGSVRFVLNSRTPEEVVSVGLGSAISFGFTLTTPKATPGVVSMEGFYWNSVAVEIGDMIVMTDPVNVTYVEVSPLTLFSGTNIAVKGTNSSLTVSIEDVSLSQEQYASVVCRLGTTFVPTTYLGNLQWTCTVFSDNATTQPLTLWYVDAFAFQGGFQISSTSLDIVFVSPINILQIHPYASLTSQNVLLHTSFVDELNGTSKVTYICQLNSEEVTPVFLENGTISCFFNKPESGALFGSISIIARVIQTGKRIILGSSVETFHFLNKIVLNTVTPHAFTQNSQSKIVTLTSTPSLSTTRGVFCKYTSLDGLALTPVMSISGNQIVCNVTKTKYASVIETLNIGIWINITNFMSTDLHLNNETIWYVKTPIQWRTGTQRIVYSESAFLMNVTTPSSSTYTFDSDVNGLPGNCVFQDNTAPNCTLDDTNFVPLARFPSFMNYRFGVKQVATGNVIYFSVDPLIYTKPLSFATMKPWVIGYSQNLYKSKRIVASFYSKLNTGISYICIISQTGYSPVIVPASFDLLENEIHNDTDSESYISCNFKTFGTKNAKYDVKLGFKNPYLVENIEITNNSTFISVVDRISLNPSAGPAIGGTNLQIPLTDFPYPTEFTNYTVTLKVNDRGVWIDATNCQYLITSISCTTPRVFDRYTDWTIFARKLPITMFINDMNAITFEPGFSFYASLDVANISPSFFIYKGQARAMTITTTTPMEYQGTQIQMIINSEIEQGNVQCSISNPTTLKCGQFTFNTPADLSLQISFNQRDYVPMRMSANKTLTIYNEIPFDIVIPSILSQSLNTSVWMVNNDGLFFNSSDVMVKISDQIINIVNQAQWINRTHLFATFDPFYFYNIPFPRNVSLQFSMDKGMYWFAPKTVEIEKTITVNLLPNMLETGTQHPLSMTGFPATGLSFNQAMYSLEFRLISTANSSNFIPLTCLAPYISCMMTQAATAGKWQFKVGLMQGSQFHEVYSISNQITFYTWVPPSSISQSIIRRFTTKNLIFYGNYDQFTNVLVSFYSVALSALPNQVKATNLFGQGLQVIPPGLPGGIYTITLSFNDGLTQHNLAPTFSIIEPWYLSEFLNINNIRQPTHMFTFSRSNATLSGGNLFNTGQIKWTMNNNWHSVDVTPYFTNLQASSNTIWTMNAPLFTELGIPSLKDIEYPFPLLLGLSLNNGADFAYVQFNYINTYPLPILASINPFVIPRKQYDISLYGLSFDLATKCSFYDANNDVVGQELWESIPVKTESLYVLNCKLGLIQQTNVTKVALYLRNIQGDRTENRFLITYYEPPTVSLLFPRSGPAAGGFPITVTGSFAPPSVVPKIYCKMGSFLCTTPCKYVKNDTLTCTSPAKSAGEDELQLSYNQIDWHISLPFTHTECPIGYGSSSYAIPCRICSPGTYKPSIGIYDCIKCENGTYSLLAGSTSCDKCAFNTTTLERGGNSYKSCVCMPGYYENPNKDEVAGTNLKCIACPIGGDCNAWNVTVPRAKQGYWYDQDNYIKFYECFPKLACPGGGFANCTSGFGGIRCGYCEKGWYKWKNNCLDCGTDYASLYLKVLVLVIGLIIAGVIFVVFSTYFPTLLTSLSITFQYWQVLSLLSKFDVPWPGAVSSGLSVASVAIFNFDFLSPACLFPGVDYPTIWVVKMLLPFVFVALIFCIYILGEIRSAWAGLMGWWFVKKLGIKYVTPYKYESTDEEDYNTMTTQELKDGTKQRAKSNRILWILNQFIWLRNTIVWISRHRSSRHDLKILFNKVLNAIGSLISFAYIYLMLTASEIFVCRTQPDGSLTLNESSDIICGVSGAWWAMFPLSIAIYIIFGLGTVVYFVIMIIQHKKSKDDIMFRERFKFILLRFKKKFFFWKLIESVRFLALSLLGIFFRPLLVVICGLLIIFLSMLLHLHFVPFSRKFHNIMEYIMLFAILLTFFFSVLFMVDISKYPSPEWYTFIVVLTIGVIVASNVIAVLMTLWDIYVRQKNLGKRSKQRRAEKRTHKIQTMKEDHVMREIFGSPGMKIAKQEDPLPFETEFDFHFIFRVLDASSSSSDEKDMTLNDMLYDLIKWERVKKKLDSVKKKFVKIHNSTKKSSVVLKKRGKKPDDDDDQ